MNIDEMLDALEAEKTLKREERVKFFKPYPKQLEFIALEASKTESAILAGNQLGKSETGAFKMTCHLTGEYPAWWPGRKWDRPITAWAAGPSAEQVKKVAQTKLCGQPGSQELWGTGMIPKRVLGRVTRSRGQPDALERIEVRHKSGGISILDFKSYDQERDKWQGPPIDYIWCDEEPPVEHYTEALARLTATRGSICCTFTPLKGMSDVVRRYMDEPSAYRGYVQMGLREAAHLTPDMIEEILERYPKHEREARLNGVPMFGEGRVYTVPEEELRLPFRIAEVPQHWTKIWGIDFGINHPFAAVLMAWDKDNDRFYILHTLRMTGAIPLQHADAMKKVAGIVPVAWPHDGHHREKGSGLSLQSIYKQHGLLMLPEHATHAAGGNSVYTGLAELDQVMQARRLKVLDGNEEWFQEYRQYHVKNGMVVKDHDDLLDATRYAYMMRRNSRPVPLGPPPRAVIGGTRPDRHAKGTTPFWHDL